MMLPNRQERAFTNFYDSVFENEILDPKTTLLIHLAVGMSLGCAP
ncbi:carboxymuconolactone decarboxylase family protein [Gemmatimonadota bacterium]